MLFPRGRGGGKLDGMHALRARPLSYNDRFYERFVTVNFNFASIA